MLKALCLALVLAPAFGPVLGPVLGQSTGGAAWAQDTSRLLFQRKAWSVRVVTFPDASLACVAQVDQANSSFAVWADGVNPLQIQFFSRAWQLGAGAADVVVRIDRRAPWNLYNAELNQQSVLFRLPTDNDGYRFLREVMRGNVISLSNNHGVLVDHWTLAGSSASINALSQCVDLLGSAAPQNPFQ